MTWSYEGFTPESDYNLYNRTLVPVETEEGIIWAWVYNMETIPNATVQILSGNWRDCFYSNLWDSKNFVAINILYVEMDRFDNLFP